MVILGIDAHKRTHTLVTVDMPGRRLNAAIHRTAVTQLLWHPDAAAYRTRRRITGAPNPKPSPPSNAASSTCLPHPPRRRHHNPHDRDPGPSGPTS
jgi:hypothetical protein